MNVHTSLNIARRTPTAPNVLVEATRTLMIDDAKAQDDLIRICLNERPRWVPSLAWTWMVKTLIRREIYKGMP